MLWNCQMFRSMFHISIARLLEPHTSKLPDWCRPPLVPGKYRPNNRMKEPQARMEDERIQSVPNSFVQSLALRNDSVWRCFVDHWYSRIPKWNWCVGMCRAINFIFPKTPHQPPGWVLPWSSEGKCPCPESTTGVNWRLDDVSKPVPRPSKDPENVAIMYYV